MKNTQYGLNKSTMSVSFKGSEDLRSKLIYEWKNLFRQITTIDLENKGTISVNAFNKIIH